MRRVCGVLAIAVLALGGCADQPSPAAPDSPDFAMSSNAPIYLVTFTDAVTDVRGTALELSRARGFALRFVREHAARGFSAVMPDAIANRLRSDPRVAIVERDRPVALIRPIIEARPGSGGQVVSYGTTRVGGSGDGTGKTAWIIDTGIDLDHPDLNTSRNCHAFFTGRSANDQNGHGTHVAGIVAAKNNATGTLGVAANAFVCSVRVLGPSGSGTFEGVTNGVNYVAANGAPGDVANMSLGASGAQPTLEQAIQDAATTGISFTLAAGNNGEDANNFTPARVNGTNIYTVSAIGSSDCLASFSNFGNPPVDFAAPGVGIVSTYKGGGTRTLSGTSMAAPHVAGILLLGPVRSDGTACNDPDGNPDPIAHR
ncbi:MAG: S8 family serine peptidase [Gemmatimonadales bacterium]